MYFAWPCWNVDQRGGDVSETLNQSGTHVCLRFEEQVSGDEHRSPLIGPRSVARCMKPPRQLKRGERERKKEKKIALSDRRGWLG